MNYLQTTTRRRLKVLGLLALFCAAGDRLAALQFGVIEHAIPAPNSFPDGIVYGPDGALWFTEYGANQIGRSTTAGRITEYPVPTPASSPYGITVGPDGALWFTEYFVGKIGRITTQGSITEYDVPTPNSFPAQITTGPDGALWFTEFSGQKIGRLTVQGQFTEFDLAPESFPIGITTGPDGALWFTESSANQIGRITTTGSITEYGVPTPFGLPQDIVTGPDGALWFTEESANKIGRITVAGAITEFPAGGGPAQITAADGALWFTEYTGVKIGRLTMQGGLTEFPVPTPGFLRGIAATPHAGIWFAENSAGRLGQLLHETAVLSATPVDLVVAGSVTINGEGFAAGETVRVNDNIGVFKVVTAGTNGAFTFTAKARPAPFGPNTFVAMGQTSHRTGVTTYFVQTVLIATPDTVSVGDQVTVTGFGFNSHDSVDLYIDNRFFAGSADSDSHGSLAGPNSIVFTVPSRLPAGSHTLDALGSNGVGASTRFTVQ